MELYTLTEDFLKKDAIDRFNSAIWTERYARPGDVTLVVDPTPEMMTKLAEGTYLALDGSDEVMILDTQTIENGVLKVEGRSLLGFLENRAFSSNGDMWAKSWYAQGFLPENLITHIIRYYVIIVDSNGDPYLYNGTVDLNTGGPMNAIPNLEIDAVASPYPPVNFAVPHGQVLDVIQQVADTWNLGIRMYLLSADESGHQLRFRVYAGIDRSTQVIFSPTLDNLRGVSELRSIRGYKTVAVAWPTDEKIGFFGVAYIPGTEDFTGWDRRTLLHWADDVYLDKIAVDPEFPSIDDFNNVLIVLEQRARDALANNNYTRVVDGEVVPQIGYTFGVDYNLGDIVSLKGHSEIVQKARITEYIRSQDPTGERAYPTVSIID